MKNTKCVAEEIDKPFSPSKAEWFIFYLLKITTDAIIKAIFMIVTPTNPKKSSLIIIINANSTISTTSHFNLTVKNCGYVKRWQHTLLISFPIVPTIQQLIIKNKRTF